MKRLVLVFTTSFKASLELPPGPTVNLTQLSGSWGVSRTHGVGLPLSFNCAGGKEAEWQEFILESADRSPRVIVAAFSLPLCKLHHRYLRINV